MLLLSGAASDVNVGEIDFYDHELTGETLSITPEAYTENAKAVLQNYAIDDLEKIEAICKTFLCVARAAVRDSDYDYTWLINGDNLNDPTIQYFRTSYNLQREIYDVTNVEISTDHIEFSDFVANVAGNSATASVVEKYTYYADEGFDDDYNYRMREYFFTLTTDDEGNWRISRVTTNDPWETADFNYAPIDVDGTIQKMQTLNNDEESVILNVESQELTPHALTPMSFNEYNPTKAIDYAVQWFDDCNSVFGFSESNCQNFASQCVWAGLYSGSILPSQASAWPAVPTSLVGDDAPNVWCRNQHTTYYSNYWLNWAWDNVGGFTKLIETSSRGRIGPVGTVRTGLSYAKAGDEIVYAETGTPSSNNLNHAMFVTEVTGTPGSQGINTIKIAANTSQTNSAYQSLAEYCSLPASQYLTISISGNASELREGEIMR